MNLVGEFQEKIHFFVTVLAGEYRLPKPVRVICETLQVQEDIQCCKYNENKETENQISFSQLHPGLSPLGPVLLTANTEMEIKIISN